MEGQEFDSRIEVMPLFVEQHKLSDLADGDVPLLLHAIEDFRAQFEDIEDELPTGLISGIEQIRQRLEDVDDPNIKDVRSSSLLELDIKRERLLLSPDVVSGIRSLGVSMRVPGREPSMETLSELIGLVRRHVSLLVSELSGFQLPVLETSNQTEAGRRILINVILLRVVSAMSTDETDVNITPEFSLEDTTFAGFYHDGVVDLLLTKLPSESRLARYLLLDLTTALENSEPIDGPVTTCIFEAKQDKVRAGVPKAVVTVAAYCKQNGIPVVRGCVTSGEQWIFFVYSANDSGGGYVAYSDEFSLGQHLEGLPIILGLLTDWVDIATVHDQRFFTYK